MGLGGGVGMGGGEAKEVARSLFMKDLCHDKETWFYVLRKPYQVKDSKQGKYNHHLLRNYPMVIFIKKFF